MLDAEVSPGFRIDTYTAPDTIPADYICRVLRIPNHLSIIAAVSDVLAYLSRPYIWEAASEEQEIQMRALMAQMVLTYFEGDCDDPMIGELRLFVASILPSNVLPCDGSTYNQGDYPTLAAILPASLKDDIAGTFTTPDFSGRFPIGVDPVEVGDYPLGSTGGEAGVTLTINEMPYHSHSIYPSENAVSLGDASLGMVAGGSQVEIDGASVGGGNAHNNIPPYFAVKIGIVAR
jgi:microcystin-dependent protein